MTTGERERKRSARVVTISAGYGAGGAAVGPMLAERLGLPFADRLIEPRGRPSVTAGEGVTDYRLAQGARVADAVARAGGSTRKADLSLVNLAALVSDGEQVVVPRRGAGVAGVSPQEGQRTETSPAGWWMATFSAHWQARHQRVVQCP